MVTSNRGRALVLLAYLVRLVVSAVLVGFLTVELVQEAQGRAGKRVQSLNDLAGLRVGLKPGTVSENLVDEINRSNNVLPARIVPVERIDQALGALSEERIDVMLADELQLRYVIASNQLPNIIPVLAIEGIRPELQGFALSRNFQPIWCGESTLPSVNSNAAVLCRSYGVKPWPGQNLSAIRKIRTEQTYEPGRQERNLKAITACRAAKTNHQLATMAARTGH